MFSQIKNNFFNLIPKVFKDTYYDKIKSIGLNKEYLKNLDAHLEAHSEIIDAVLLSNLSSDFIVLHTSPIAINIAPKTDKDGNILHFQEVIDDDGNIFFAYV